MLRSLLLVALTLGLATGCSKSAAGPKGPEATLPELDRALQAWLMTKGTLPADVNALTNFPALQGKRLPTVPPGKKLIIDPTTRRVVIIDS